MLLFDDAGAGSDDAVVDDGVRSCCFRFSFNESDTNVEDDSDCPEDANPAPTSSTESLLPSLSLLDVSGDVESIAAVFKESFGFAMVSLY